MPRAKFDAVVADAEKEVTKIKIEAQEKHLDLVPGELTVGPIL